ncbi:hypothetical protein GGX14DRAFT_385892 [Mycena pura]|uniref:Uncharacterized protein n=1 Tax=Mycena pura TaxID=153505 RepID=A0AAD7E4M4_9AGAR|nr:hypothetical protein GGX14DRAFT_385892 [Mycena pura]
MGHNSPEVKFHKVSLKEETMQIEGELRNYLSLIYRASGCSEWSCLQGRVAVPRYGPGGNPRYRSPLAPMPGIEQAHPPVVARGAMERDIVINPRRDSRGNCAQLNPRAGPGYSTAIDTLQSALSRQRRCAAETSECGCDADARGAITRDWTQGGSALTRVARNPSSLLALRLWGVWGSVVSRCRCAGGSKELLAALRLQKAQKLGYIGISRHSEPSRRRGRGAVTSSGPGGSSRPCRGKNPRKTDGGQMLVWCMPDPGR